MRRPAKSYQYFILLLLAAFLLWLAGQNPAFILTGYSSGIFPVIAQMLRSVSALFPFSLGDVLYVAFIAAALRGMVVFIRSYRNKKARKPFSTSLFRLGNIILVLYIGFKLLWGLNYSRPMINTQLGIGNEKYGVRELMKLGGYYILKINGLKADRSVYYSVYNLEAGAVKAYDKLSKVNALFKYKNPCVKPVLNSWAISRIGLQGYYNPFTGEANVNMRMPRFSLPFTVCHEIAHQAGIGREDEANLLAYLTAINSDDVNFRYSAYYSILLHILFELRYASKADFDKLYALLPQQVLDDLAAEKAFWQKYNSELFNYMDAALDSYLKLNDQNEGIKSYRNITLWVYNFHKEEL